MLEIKKTKKIILMHFQEKNNTFKKYFIKPILIHYPTQGLSNE